MTNDEQTKSESPEVTLPHQPSQRSKAELEQGFRIDATFEELAETVLRPLKIRYVKPPKRR